MLLVLNLSSMTKRIVTGLLAVVFVFGGVSVASASDFDWHWNLRDSSDSSDYQYNLTPPNDGQDYFLELDGPTQQPKFTYTLPYLTVVTNMASTTYPDSNGQAGFMRVSDKAKLDTLPTLQWYNNGSIVTNLKHVTFSGTTTSGAATFYLTSDGTSSGTALCTNAPQNVQIGTNDPSNTFGVGYTVTNSNKNLNLTVNARSFTSTSILGISVLGASTLAAATNGTPVYATVDCN